MNRLLYIKLIFCLMLALSMSIGTAKLQMYAFFSIMNLYDVGKGLNTTFLLMSKGSSKIVIIFTSVHSVLFCDPLPLPKAYF